LSCTAVEKAINASNIGHKSTAYQHYLSAVSGKSNGEAREIAKDILGESPFWDWDRKLSISLLTDILKFFSVPRTREGYYHYTGGVDVGYHHATAEKFNVPLHRLQLNVRWSSHLMQTSYGWKQRSQTSNKPVHSRVKSGRHVLASGSCII
jgi:hypothetical protein